MSTAAEPALVLDGVSRAFKGFMAVRDVSLSVFDQELHCIIGPNGAGKTTLFNLVSGAVFPQSGRVLFEGQDITRWSADARARAGVARSFQKPRIFEALTVFENVRLAAQIHHQSFNPVRRRTDRGLLEETWKGLNLAGLVSRADEIAAVLSHAERAWLQLAMIAARPSKLVLLDEPTAGMAHHDVVRAGDFIRDLHRGRTTVIVEHDLDFVKNIADRISVLDGRQLVVTGTPKEIQSDRAVRAAYLQEVVPV